MGQIQLKGVTTDEDGNVFADDDSPLGQVAQRMQRNSGGGGGGGGNDLLTTAAAACRVVTGLIDQDTASVTRDNLRYAYRQAERLRADFDTQVASVGDGPTRTALQTLSRIDRVQDDAIQYSSDLASLQRRMSLNNALAGGMELAGQFLGNGGGGGGGGFGGGGGGLGVGGTVALAGAAGFAGYLLADNSNDNNYRDRGNRYRY